MLALWGGNADAHPPTPTPEPTPVVVSVEDIICEPDWPCEEALLVSWCESRHESVISATNDYGLFQINSIHAYRVGGVVERLLDIRTNVRVAYEIYLERGRSWFDWRYSFSCHGLN